MSIPNSLLARGYEIQTYVSDRQKATTRSIPYSARVFRPYTHFAQYQILSLWCWNAVGCSIIDYFSQGEAGDLSIQCRNAARVFNNTGCCEIRLTDGARIDGFKPLIVEQKPMPWPPDSRGANRRSKVEDVIARSPSIAFNAPDIYGNGPSRQQKEAVHDAVRSGSLVVIYVKTGDDLHAVVLYGLLEEDDNIRYLIADPWDGLETREKPQLRGTWHASLIVSSTNSFRFS